MICDLPLPDGGPASTAQFQTKSFENLLDTYQIDDEGVLRKYKRDTMADEECWIPYDYTGDISFYCMDRSDDQWYEYHADLQKGKVTSLKVAPHVMERYNLNDPLKARGLTT